MENYTFGLKNFRVFDEKGAEFEIAPITILTGCNSSGKSTAIKSLMLLKQFFTTLKDDYESGKSINISSYELLFNKGKHNLGTFQKTLSKYGKPEKDAPKMTFAWTKYSHLFMKDIRIEVTFIENHKNIFNNGVINGIKIFLNSKEIVDLDFTNDFDFHIDYQLFKKYFFQFTEIVKHYDSIVDILGFNDERGLQNQYKDEIELKEDEQINTQAIESLLYWICRLN